MVFMSSAGERNLHFVILALQHDLVQRGPLVRALQNWSRDRSRPIAEALVQTGAMQPADRRFLDDLIDAPFTLARSDQSLQGTPPQALFLKAETDGLLSALVDASKTHDRNGQSLPSTTLRKEDASPFGFELMDEVGRGGMGVVHRAQDLTLGREVAVKLLQEKYEPTSPAAVRFLDEARITGQLQHPGVPAVYEVGALGNGRPYLAMKLVKGQTLDQLIAAGKAIDTLAVFESICQTVGYAHAHGVVHRDLKPQNVMVGAFGEVQVMDWGLAKVLVSRKGEPNAPNDDPDATTAPTEIKIGRNSDTPFTLHGSVLGTPSYMSPEQAAGESDRIGPPADVFGLGAILCSMLTGRPPFTGKDSETVRINAVRGNTEEAFRRLDECGGDADLVALCKRCLAFDPAQRPATANEVAAVITELRLAAAERLRQAEKEKHEADVRAAEQSKRRRVVQWSAGAVVVVLALGAVGTSVGLVQSVRARDQTKAALDDLEEQQAATAVALKSERQARNEEAKERAKAVAARNEAIEDEKTALSVVEFFEHKVLAAARPKGQEGGLGKEASLKDALIASLPALDTGFASRPLVEARIRSTFATTFYFLGDTNHCLEQFKRAHAIYQKVLGPDHAATLQSASELAQAYLEQDRAAEVLPLLERSMAEMRRRRGTDGPEFLAVANVLANAFMILGRHAESLPLRQETVAYCDRALAPDALDALRMKLGLANTYYHLKRHAEAAALLEKVVAIFKASHPDSPEGHAAADMLSNAYSGLGRDEDARKLLEETVAKHRATLPPDHAYLLNAVYNLARNYNRAGRIADAEALYKEAAAGSKRSLGAQHARTLLAQEELAKLYVKTGRRDEALDLKIQVLAARRKTLPKHHPQLAFSVGAVADLLMSLKRSAEAVALIDECLASMPESAIARPVLHEMMRARFLHFLRPLHLDELRKTTARWETVVGNDAEQLYLAACRRAITSEQLAKASKQAEAATDADLAMNWLRKSVAAGMRNRARLEQDVDLNGIRNREDFKKLLESLPRNPKVAPTAKPAGATK
jgi:serine/threonine protein kinase